MASKAELKMLKDYNLPYHLTFKRMKWDQFFIGLFGALAIFGVLMKIWKEPFWGLITPETGKLLFEIFMPLGFIGESIVFIVMGFLKGEDSEEISADEFEKYLDSEEDKQKETIVVNLEMPESLTRMLEEKASRQIDAKVRELTDLLVQDLNNARENLLATRELNDNIKSLSGDLNDNILGVSRSLAGFSESLNHISGKLEKMSAIDVNAFNAHTRTVINNLEATHSELNVLEREMKLLAARFKSFNNNNHTR